MLKYKVSRLKFFRKLIGSKIALWLSLNVRPIWLYLKNKLLGYESILVLGDSHTKVFKLVKYQKYKFILVSIAGATASGLKNPNIPNAMSPRHEFKKVIKKFPGKKILFCLGEVDTAFVIFHRFENNKETSLENSINYTVDSYMQFMNQYTFKKEVYCMSCPIPFLDNSFFKGKTNQKMNLRYQTKADLKEKINAAVLFNDEVKKQSEHNNIKYIDVSNDVLSKEGVVNKSLTKGTKDHHYNIYSYARIIEKNLSKINL